MQLKQVPSSMPARVVQTRAGVRFASSEQAATAVQATDPLKDAMSSEYRELLLMKRRDREVRQPGQVQTTAVGTQVKGGREDGYETGPNAARDPAPTIRRMQVAHDAARPPARPSAQGRTISMDPVHTGFAARTEQRHEGEENMEAAPGTTREGMAAAVVGALDAYRAVAGPASRRPALDVTA